MIMPEIKDIWFLYHKYIMQTKNNIVKRVSPWVSYMYFEGLILL